MLKPRPYITILGKQRHTYTVLVMTGYILGSVLFLALSLVKGLNLGAGVMAVWVSMGASWGLGRLVKYLTGKESFVFLHYALTMMLASMGVLWLWGEPSLPYLDALIMGIWVGLMVGRWGCFHAGCCHGTYSQLGICYPQSHPSAGSRIFPIQLAESLGVGLIWLFALWQYLFIQPAAGVVLALGWVGYAWLRFGLEIFRGDADRPYFLGISEAQWSLVGIMVVIMVLLPLNAGLTWSIWAFFLMAGLWFAWLQSTPGRRYRLLQPRHLASVSAQLSKRWVRELISADQPSGQVDISPLGIRSFLKKTALQTWYISLGGATPEVLNRMLVRIKDKVWPQYSLREIAVKGDSRTWILKASQHTPSVSQEEIELQNKEVAHV